MWVTVTPGGGGHYSSMSFPGLTQGCRHTQEEELVDITAAKQTVKRDEWHRAVTVLIQNAAERNKRHHRALAAGVLLPRPLQILFTALQIRGPGLGLWPPHNHSEPHVKGHMDSRGDWALSVPRTVHDPSRSPLLATHCSLQVAQDLDSGLLGAHLLVNLSIPCSLSVTGAGLSLFVQWQLGHREYKLQKNLCGISPGLQLGGRRGKRLRWELPRDGRKAGKEGKEAGGPRRCLIIPGASPAKNPGENYRHLMKVPGKWDSDRN